MRIIANKKGFTLIELLIVISIIGILAVAFLPSMMGAPAKARDVKRIQDLRKLYGVITSSNLTLPSVHCWDGSSGISATVKSSYLPALGGILPQDPISTNNSLLNACGTIASCNGSYFSINCGPTFINNVLVAHVEDSSNGNVADPCACDPVLGNSGSYYILKMQK